jgi:osmotically-inducible protein OsmY
MLRLPRPSALLALFSAAAGAAASYFLDPLSGRRRRHTTRDRAASLTRRGAHRGRRFARHALSEGVGRAKRLANSLPHEEPELDDTTLAHKVESILFRDRDVPKGRINVNAENGVVFLRGEVDGADLLQTLESRVRKVKGVKGVENLLHVPGQSPPDR